MLRRKPNFTFIACFHAQQCAEKYLKALLLLHQSQFAKTHDLVALQGQCEQAGVIVSIETRLLNDLTEYAVRTRYPGDLPSPEEAQSAYQTAKLVRKLVRKHLGIGR